MRRFIISIFLFVFCINCFAQIDVIRKAAESGDIDAQLYLAEAYSKGKGVIVNLQEGYRWYMEAAKQNNAEAQYMVARYKMFYMGGWDDKADYERSLVWLEKSAVNGYPPAQTAYALDVLLPQKRTDEAMQMLFLALRNFDPAAAIALGWIYYDGIYVKQDLSKAKGFFEMAKLAKIANSYLGLAYCAEKEADYKKAYEYYKKAIDGNEIQAYNDLAYLYARGKGVKKDLKEAHRLIDMAISKEPTKPNYYNSKGEFYLMENNMTGAKEMWNKITTLVDPKVLKNLATPLALAMTNSVDNRIPETEVKSDKTFAVIFANEEYKRVASVPFAKKDGEIFAEYCRKTLGVPDENVYLVNDATLGDMKYYVNLLTKIAGAYDGEANIILYYSGHGIPDVAQKTGYLLPTDGYGSDATSGYSLKSLYKELASIPSKSIVVFLDACFSGAQRDGKMLDPARGIAIKPQTDRPYGNVVVFSASSSDETAYPYKEQGHGMFTYYLLKKLQETKGDVTLGELGDFVKTQVERQSVVVNGKLQTPTLIPSATVGNDWKNWKLK